MQNSKLQNYVTLNSFRLPPSFHYPMVRKPCWQTSCVLTSCVMVKASHTGQGPGLYFSRSTPSPPSYCTPWSWWRVTTKVLPACDILSMLCFRKGDISHTMHLRKRQSPCLQCVPDTHCSIGVESDSEEILLLRWTGTARDWLKRYKGTCKSLDAIH